MDDETKKDIKPDEANTDLNSIAKPDSSVEEAEVLDMFEGLPSQEKSSFRMR